MAPGDVFIQGGSPGHAVIVVDVALNPDTRKKVYLLAQSYTHIKGRFPRPVRHKGR